jgi:Polyglycine hydrolase-like, structural repeat
MRISTNTWRNVAAMVVVFALALLAMESPQTAVETDCHWVGTAPFCDGECPEGESEMSRLSSLAGPPYSNGPDFGKSCTTGSKALCCKTPGRICRWDGTAPFCDGKCRGDETETQPPNGVAGGGGKECWSGSKVYCCTSTPTGSGSSAIQANPGWTRYAAVWEKGAGPAWQARHGLTSAQYQQEFDTLGKQGYRLVDVSGYSVGDQDRYAAIWEKRQGPAWVARHGLTSAQYQQEFNNLGQQGYRLARISGWRSGAMAHYAAIWEKIEGPAWVGRHGMLSSAYQEEFDKLAKEGYRLTHVSGYHTYD